MQSPDQVSTHPEGRGQYSEAAPAVLPQMLGVRRYGAEHEDGSPLLIWCILNHRA